MTDLEFYIEWEQVKEDMTLADFARSHNMTAGQMKNRVYRGKAAFRNLDDSDFAPSVEYEGPNQADVFYQKRTTIPTVEEIMREADLDPEEWQVADELLIKIWQGFIKNAEGRPETVDLYSIRAPFVRKVLVPLEPHVQPLRIEFPRPAMIDRSQGIDVDYETTVVLFDAQLGLTRDLRTGEYSPTHDRLALDVAGQIIEDVRPDNLVIAGDWMDFAGLSTHFAVKPGSAYTTQPETIESAWWLSRFTHFAGETYYIAGNHEDRMTSYMLKNAHQFYGLRNPFKTDGAAALSVENLLGLEDLGIPYLSGYPNNELWLEDDLLVIHGSTSRRAALATTAQAHKMYPNVSVLFGHTHRPERLNFNLETRYGPKYMFVGNPGCLCRLDQVVPGHRKASDWGNGLAVLHHNPRWHTAQFVQIVEGRGFYGDRSYQGHFEIEQLRADTAHTGWRL